MNMKKKGMTMHTSRLFPLAKPARIILWCGSPPILLSLLRLLWEVLARGEFTVNTARYFGGMLEFPLAALMLVTGGALLADVAAKRNDRDT